MHAASGCMHACRLSHLSPPAAGGSTRRQHAASTAKVAAHGCIRRHPVPHPVVRWDPAGLKVLALPRTSDDADWQLPSAGSIGGGLRQHQNGGASGDGSGSNRKNGTRMPPPGRRRRRLALALVAAAASWLLLTGIYMGSLLHAPVRIPVEPPHACSDVAA